MTGKVIVFVRDPQIAESEDRPVRIDPRFFKFCLSCSGPRFFLFFGPVQVFEVFHGPDPVDQNIDMDITLVPGVEVNLGPDLAQFEI